MFGDHRAIGNDADFCSRAAQRNRAAGEFGRNTVAVAIQYHEAGAGDPRHMFQIPIEDGRDWPQSTLLVSEAGRDRTIRGHRVLALSQRAAARCQPRIQRLEAGKAGWQSGPAA
jgi:hypothetical protein